jgi:hypothetical protein
MFKNLTSHPVAVYASDGSCRVINPEKGQAARCSEINTFIDEHEGISLMAKDFDSIENLPEPKEGIYYIVSMIVALAAWKVGRVDVVTVTQYVRDGAGAKVGCRAFGVNPSLVKEN